MRKYWGFAVEQLPYETAEGGYQGTTYTTSEILYDDICLSLPRDRGDRLYYALLRNLTDETWCEYDWLSLDRDVALKMSWERFCETVKHQRRFFFHATGTDDRDSYTPASLLTAIARASEYLGLISEIPAGTKLWRARTDLTSRKKAVAADFGPPPVHLALQSNRMNPPGIPMVYLASTAKTALRETRSRTARVGQWEANRALRVLDLRDLPPIPGVFAEESRQERLMIRFLHHFADDIMTPVERDERVHIDYLPSQVITEYLRDFEFNGGQLDGIAYGSTVDRGRWNVALFANRVELGLEEPEWGRRPVPLLSFRRVVRVNL